MYQDILKGIMLNNQEAMEWLSKIIAANIRNRLEDLHATSPHLPDSLMPELNREIRGGVYDILVAMANADHEAFCQQFIGYTYNTIPNYWEDPVLNKELNKALLPKGKIEFESDFLNQQYELGNIYQVPNTLYIQTKGSYEFIEVDYDDRRKHLGKISRLLRKENYVFDHCLDCYIKQSQ